MVACLANKGDDIDNWSMQSLEDVVKMYKDEQGSILPDSNITESTLTEYAGFKGDSNVRCR